MTAFDREPLRSLRARLAPAVIGPILLVAVIASWLVAPDDAALPDEVSLCDAFAGMVVVGVIAHPPGIGRATAEPLAELMRAAGERASSTAHGDRRAAVTGDDAWARSPTHAALPRALP